MTVDAGVITWIIGSVAALIFTLVTCTAGIIMFLWKKFDVVNDKFGAVYDQIEEIKLHQGSKFVKHEVCSKRIEEVKVDINKDIQIAISKHEENHH